MADVFFLWKLSANVLTFYENNVNTKHLTIVLLFLYNNFSLFILELIYEHDAIFLPGCEILAFTEDTEGDPQQQLSLFPSCELQMLPEWQKQAVGDIDLLPQSPLSSMSCKSGRLNPAEAAID